MNKSIFILTFSFLFLTLCRPYAQDIKISDADIALMKLEKNIEELKNSVSEIRETVKMSGENSSALAEKITKLEDAVALLNKNFEEISSLRRQLAALEKLQAENRDGLIKTFDNKIKANEDATKIILGDIYRLREDIIAGRKPVVSAKKPFKEYVPYIALGVSVISLIIAVH